MPHVRLSAVRDNGLSLTIDGRFADGLQESVEDNLVLALMGRRS